MLIGSDRDTEALDAARDNVGPRYKPIRLEHWDAASLPLEDASVNKLITNLPWGIRYGSHGENRRLYPRWIAEFTRVLKPDGLMVMLTAEWSLMRALAARRTLTPASVTRVSVLGTPASVWVCRRS
jgi:tRNA (guanine6-N2)-methyltransferase